jgi:hypothetical protein
MTTCYGSTDAGVFEYCVKIEYKSVDLLDISYAIKDCYVHVMADNASCYDVKVINLCKLNALHTIICLWLLGVAYVLVVHLAQPLNHDLMSLVSRLNLEQFVHPLKRNTLGLRDQEVNVWD